MYVIDMANSLSGHDSDASFQMAVLCSGFPVFE